MSVLVIRVSTRTWLVLDRAHHPAYLIQHTLAVHQATHETEYMYRILRHALEPDDREVVHWADGFMAAAEWCRDQIDAPTLRSPVRDGYSTSITVDEQRARWAAGLDPRTGEPRPAPEPPVVIGGYGVRPNELP